MFPFNQSFPWRTVAIATTVALLYCMFGAIPSELIYQENNLPELWRLISAHFVHSDSGHLIWNLVGFLFLGALLEFKTGSGLFMAIVAGIVSVDILLLVDHRIAAYCGLSGVLNTLLAWLLIEHLSDSALRPWAVMTLACALLKIIVEVNLDTALFTHTAWPSIPLSHLFGFIGGFIWRAISSYPNFLNWVFGTKMRS